MSHKIFKDLKIFNVGVDLPPVIYYIGDDNNVSPQDFSTRYIGISTYSDPYDMLEKLYQNNRMDFCPNVRGKGDFIRMGLKHIGGKIEIQKINLEVKARLNTKLIEKDKEVTNYYNQIMELTETINVTEKTDYYSGEKKTILKGDVKNNLKLFKLINKNRKINIDVYTYVKKGSRISNTLKSAFKNRTQKMDFSELLQFLIKNPNHDYKVKLNEKCSYFGRTLYAKYIKSDKRRNVHLFKKQKNSPGGYNPEYTVSILTKENKKEMEILI